MKRGLLLLTVFLLPIFLFADSTMYLSDYDVEIQVSQKGNHKVIEDLNFNYLSPHHGFYRSIPTSFSNVTASIRNISSSEDYSTERNNGYFVIKVGDPDRTVKGLKQYNLSYNYKLPGDINSGYDEFYFNIIGSAWEIEIKNCTFKIVFPEGTPLDKVWITRGQYGSDNQDGIDWEVVGNVIQGTATDFSPYEAMTIRVELPDGWYNLKSPFLVARTNLIILVLLSLICLFLSWFIWNSRGKDKTLIVVPQFVPPENLSPLEVGYLADMRVDNKDVTSLLFYWADKGYLKIIEESKKKYKFIKLKNLTGSEFSEQQKILFNAFFTKKEVTLKDFDGEKFFIAMGKASKKVRTQFSKETPLLSKESSKNTLLILATVLFPFCGLSILVTTGNFSIIQFLFVLVLFVLTLMFQPLMIRVARKYDQKKYAIFSFIATFLIILLLLTIISVILGSLYLIDYLLIGCFIVAVSQTFCMFFAAIVPKRSEYGQSILEKTLGFKDFIETVEIDKLKMMIDDDPEFFYKILSYAIVFGLEKKWAKKFEKLAIQEPSWYDGRSRFNPLIVPALVHSINSNFSPSMPKVSSSQGSSTGMGSSGFSGGGFGGGGGGGW